MLRERRDSHAVFYYYGIEHLLVNLYQYIKPAIEKKERIILYVEPKVFGKLLSELNFTRQSLDRINYKSLKGLVFNNVDKQIEQIFAGQPTKCVVQASYVIREAGKEKLPVMEKQLNKIVDARRNTSVLCMYDFEDYMKEKKVIDEEVMELSRNSHPFFFSKCELQEK